MQRILDNVLLDPRCTQVGVACSSGWWGGSEGGGGVVMGLDSTTQTACRWTRAALRWVQVCVVVHVCVEKRGWEWWALWRAGLCSTAADGLLLHPRCTQLRTAGEELVVLPLCGNWAGGWAGCSGMQSTASLLPVP